MKKVLIAGASRGIGLELAVQYAAEGWDVTAACRDPEQARGWLPAACAVKKLDVTSATSVGALAWELDEAPLDLLICNAGLFGPHSEQFAAPGDDEFNRVMSTNVLGPMRLIQAFGRTVVAAKGVIVVMTSKMGSITETSGSSAVLYRASKAAANMVTKTAAIEYGPQGATVIAMHPGWVRTDMGGANALLGVTESVEQIRATLNKVDADDNGRFIDFSGRGLDW